MQHLIPGLCHLEASKNLLQSNFTQGNRPLRVGEGPFYLHTPGYCYQQGVSSPGRFRSQVHGFVAGSNFPLLFLRQNSLELVSYTVFPKNCSRVSNVLPPEIILLWKPSRRASPSIHPWRNSSFLRELSSRNTTLRDELAGGLQAGFTYGKPMENLWKTYGF